MRLESEEMPPKDVLTIDYAFEVVKRNYCNFRILHHVEKQHVQNRNVLLLHDLRSVAKLIEDCIVLTAGQQKSPA